jgi:hypothetical protein
MNQHVIPPRPVDGLPAQGVDVPRAQVDAINCMIGIIDEPYTGYDDVDYNLRRNKCEAARVLLSLKTRMLRGCSGTHPRRTGAGKSRFAREQIGADQAGLLAEENARARQTAEQRARQEAEERATWEQLAQEVEREKQALRKRLDAVQRLAEARPVNFQEFIEEGETAAQKIDLDEAATRRIVDQQLRDRGWEADTQKLIYAAGARPAKGRATALAEWPTESGPADHALFVGLTCVGVIEAKRKRKNVSAAIDQAERYSRGFSFGDYIVDKHARNGDQRVLGGRVADVGGTTCSDFSSKPV